MTLHIYSTWLGDGHILEKNMAPLNQTTQTFSCKTFRSLLFGSSDLLAADLAGDLVGVLSLFFGVILTFTPFEFLGLLGPFLRLLLGGDKAGFFCPGGISSFFSSSSTGSGVFALTCFPPLPFRPFPFPFPFLPFPDVFPSCSSCSSRSVLSGSSSFSSSALTAFRIFLCA